MDTKYTCKRKREEKKKENSHFAFLHITSMHIWTRFGRERGRRGGEGGGAKRRGRVEGKGGGRTHVPLLKGENTLHHSSPVVASLLASITLIGSMTHSGVIKSHKLSFIIPLVVSIVT